MNQYLTYPNFELWDEKKWEFNGSPIAPVIRKLSAAAKELPAYPDPAAEPQKEPGYQLKPNVVEVPAVMEALKENGILCVTKTLGGDRWTQVIPESVLGDRLKKVPVLVFMVRADKPDPYWTMRVLEEYKDDIEKMASAGSYLILFLAVDPEHDFTPEILMMLTECFALYPADIDRLYLDVTPLDSNELAGWKETEYAGRRAIDISRKWEAAKAHNVNLYNSGLQKEPDVDGEWLVHSMSGKALMEGVVLEYQYRHADEPGLMQFLRQMGLQYEAHEYKGNRYITVTPLCALDGSSDHKIPCLLTMMEVAYTTEHGVVTALSNYLEYLKIAAEGEFMMVFFVLEDMEDNELLSEITEECCAQYPIDRSRIYLTGHSHNSAYALEYYRRHPLEIAACSAMNFPAILPQPKGGETAPNTDEWIEKMSHYDLPLINIGGYNEVHGGPGIYPVVDEEGWWKGWNRRLRSERCPERTREEILAASGSRNIVERALRVPADKSEVLYLMGFEHYIADYQNVDGKYHFRVVSVQNMPHMITPTLAAMSWNFMRRFARNLETGETIELY